MKILFLSESYLPHAGGSRVYYHNLLRRLTRAYGYRVRVLTTKAEGDQDFDRGESNDTLRILRCGVAAEAFRLSNWPQFLALFARTLYHCVAFRPNILHAGDLFPHGLICYLINRLFGIDYAIYCHGEEITQTNRFRRQPALRNEIYRRAAHVVAASPFAMRLLKQEGIPVDSISLVPVGVDSERFAASHHNPSLIQKYGLEGKQIVLTVGRLCARKGHDVALPAIASLIARYPNLHYVIAGTGPDQSRLESLAICLGIRKNVTLTGYLDEDALPALYASASIFLLPNREEKNGDVEGFGLVFLEANAAGKPVIGGRSGGAVDAIVDGVTGVLVDPTKPEDVAAALEKLLANADLREEMGSAGRQRAYKDFSWEQSAALLNDLHNPNPHEPKESAKHASVSVG